MSEISLFLSNVGVSVGRSMDEQQFHQSPTKDFESVELGDLAQRGAGGGAGAGGPGGAGGVGGAGGAGGAQQREKVPRRIIHFSSGETMEEYSTDEEEGEEEEQERKDLLSSPPVDASKLTWGPYFWFHMWRAATSTISACDYLGERMASLFGITSAKYQYAIDEYYRMKKEREEEKEEARLSEEAEQSFDHLRPRDTEDEPITATQGSEVADSQVTCQIENENLAVSSTITVPAIVTAT